MCAASAWTWKSVPLSLVMTLQSGYSFKSSAWTNTGCPVARIGDIKSTGLRREAMVCVDSRTAAEAASFTLSPGDVLVAMTGEVGHVAFVQEQDLPMLVNQRVGLVRFSPNSPVVSSRFLYYLCLLPATKQQFVALAHGSVQPNLSAGAISNVLVPLPPPAEQQAIAEVLGTLDDKIECNDRLARLADERWTDELTQALNGWDVGGPLPSGWSRASLSSLARFVNGRNFTKDATGTGRMVVRIAELNSGPGRSTVYNEIDVPSDHVARPGDLLFAWSGSLTVQRWFRPEAIVNQHIFKVIPHSDIPTWLVHGYLLKLLPWYRQIAAGKATTMGHIQRHHLDEPVPLPDAATRNAFDERCAPLWHRALAAEQESLVLAQLRDTLLPRLLSGELRIRNAEAAVEGVA
jgi:type I restriction enzyme, S subunit